MWPSTQAGWWRDQSASLTYASTTCYEYEEMRNLWMCSCSYSFRNVHRVNRELDVSEDLDCPTKVPRVSSWNRPSHRILPSEAKTLQLERCVAERTQLGRNEHPFFESNIRGFEFHFL